MTMDEINKMIANYESKWGKLGHTNIMNPEKNTIHHSGINKDSSQGGNKTMSRMDNELYKFRQKVAAGKEANKLAHKSYISPDELNEMNYEQLMKSRTLIHAANPMKGQQRENVKYYRREGQPGNYRYYYTKEEYDAAHKQDNAQTEANREAQERQQYENDKKAANNNGPSKFNNMRADVVNEYAKIAREASSKDAAKAFYDMAKGGNEAIDELYSTIQDGFKSGKLSYKDGRFETDDDQLREDIESFSDNIQKFAKQIGEASGKGREIQDELEKLMLPDIEAMSKKEQNTKKDNSRKQELAKDNKANRLDNGENVKTNETNFPEDKEKGEKLFTGDSKEAQEMRIAYNDLWDENWKDDFDHSNYQEGANRQFKSLYKTAKLLEMYGMNPSNDLKSAYSYIKPNSKEGQNIIKEADKEFEEFMKSHKHLEKYFSKKEVKHSTSGKALITNSAMGDEIMDEYSVFMEKAKRGKEKNRIAHSIFISPEDLNARYEKDLESQGILVHAGNYKYYNKIDMPNGTTRYFYTKAEWDAYHEGNERSKYEQQKKNFENNKKAAEAEGDRYKKPEQKPLPKSATMTDEERKGMYEGLAKKAKIHNQQVKNYENNKKAAEAEGERMAQKYAAMKSINSPKTDSKTTDTTEDNKPEKIQTPQKTSTEYVQKNAERINNEYNKAAEDEHNTSLKIDEKYGFNKAETEEEFNKCWDNLVQDMYQAALSIDNPDNCYMNFFWHDENGNGSAGWDISIPEFDKWAQEYQKEMDKVFEKAHNATSYDEKKSYGDQWEAMNEELSVRIQEAKTKTLKMVTNLKKKCLE